MPDDAREVIFPEGVPLITQEVVKSPTVSVEASAVIPEEETDSVTEAEGNLANEKSELEASAGENAPAEAKQNLLEN